MNAPHRLESLHHKTQRYTWVGRVMNIIGKVCLVAVFAFITAFLIITVTMHPY